MEGWREEWGGQGTADKGRRKRRDDDDDDDDDEIGSKKLDGIAVQEKTGGKGEGKMERRRKGRKV